MSLHKLLDLGVPVLLLGILVLFGVIMGGLFLAMLITCCCEKQRVRDFVAAPADSLPPPSRYFQAMNDAAVALGYQHGGLFGQDRRGSTTYRCCLSLWLSPDQKSILCIAGGKLARIDYKRTMLISMFNNGMSLVSMDAFGSEDLSGTRDVQVLMNADLHELNQFHLQRLARLNAEARLFNPDSIFTEFNEWNKQRADRLVEQRLARYLSPEHNDWRFTLSGAWRYATTAYFSGLKKAQTQEHRRHIKRPGS